MQSQLVKMINIFEKIITAFSAVMLGILSILICAQVFARYVISRFITNINVFWIEEISVTIMMWIGLLGAAGCVWTDSHMSLNLFLEKIPVKIKIWIKVLIDI